MLFALKETDRDVMIVINSVDLVNKLNIKKLYVTVCYCALSIVSESWFLDDLPQDRCGSFKGRAWFKTEDRTKYLAVFHRIGSKVRIHHRR